MNLSQALVHAGKVLQIDQSQVKGAPGTGFEKSGNKGPFECGNCSHMYKGYCHQSIMIKLSRGMPTDSSGNPKVGEHDCCEYVDRVGGK